MMWLGVFLACTCVCFAAMGSKMLEIKRQSRTRYRTSTKVTTRTTTTISYMITRDQHQQLADLGYTREERQNMTPEQAHSILEDQA